MYLNQTTPERVKVTGIIIILFGVCVSMPAGAQSDLLETKQLDNGVMVVHERQQKPPVIALRLFLPSGSAVDPAGHEGIARLTARLLTSQTKRRDLNAFSEFVEAHGLKVSASVEPDFTMLSFTGTVDFREDLFRLAHEVLTQPSFDTGAFQQLKRQQIASLSQRRDRAFTYAYDEALELFYGNHPYAHPSPGRLESVQSLTPSDAREFYRQHYATGELVMSTVGDVPIERLITLGRRVELPAPTHTTEIAPPDTHPARHVFRNHTVDQPTHLMLYPAPSIREDDYVALKLLDALLGGGMGSVLFTEIREKRSMGYAVGSSYPSRRVESYVLVYLGGGSRTGTTFQQVFEEIVGRIAEDGPDPEDLAQAREYLKGRFLLDHETPGKRAWYRGFYEIMGRGAGFDRRFTEEVDKVTDNRIRALVRRVFLQQNPLFLTLRSEPEPNG